MKRFVSVLITLLALLLPVMAQKKIDDGLIYDQVRLRLANDPDIKGGNLTVDVKDGVVTISGRVERELGKRKADKVAKKVKGVKQVINQLKVEP